jgi:hypothetical protein
MDGDIGEAKKFTRDLLVEWRRRGVLDEARDRTRTVSGAALLVLAVSYLVSGRATGVSATVATAWLWASAVVAVAVGSVHLLLRLRSLEDPGDVVTTDGILVALASVVLAGGALLANRSPAARAAWRYLLSDVPYRVDGEDGRPGWSSSRGEDANRVGRYVRRAGFLSALVVVAHQFYLAALGRATVALPAVPDAGGGFEPGVVDLQFGAAEAVLLVLGAAVVGSVLGFLLAVTRATR